MRVALLVRAEEARGAQSMRRACFVWGTRTGKPHCRDVPVLGGFTAALLQRHDRIGQFRVSFTAETRPLWAVSRQFHCRDRPVLGGFAAGADPGWVSHAGHAVHRLCHSCFPLDGQIGEDYGSISDLCHLFGQCRQTPLIYLSIYVCMSAIIALLGRTYHTSRGSGRDSAHR